VIGERAHPRYAHEASLVLYVGDQEIYGRTRNLSRGGLCADLLAPIPMGTDLEVDIKLLFEGERESEALRLPARAVWCTTMDEGFQIGLVFKPLGRELAEYLQLFLRFLDDGTRPERARRESKVDKRFPT
jgi:hypothetical protein